MTRTVLTENTDGSSGTVHKEKNNIHSTQQSRLIQTLIVIHNVFSRFRYLYLKVHSAEQSCPIQTLIETLMHFPGTDTVDTQVHKSKMKIHSPQQSCLIQTLIVIHNLYFTENTDGSSGTVHKEKNNIHSTQQSQVQGGLFVYHQLLKGVEGPHPPSPHSPHHQSMRGGKGPHPPSPAFPTTSK